MARWIPLFLAAIPIWSGAVELTTILSSLKGSGVPDTSEYRVTTTFQVGGQPMSTTMKVVQSGKGLSWSEATVAGRTVRVVRNGSRQRILDVGSGESHTMAATTDQGPSSMDWNRLASLTWTDPVESPSGLWVIRQISGLDSGLAGRILEWSASDAHPRRLVQWSSSGDTTRASIQWSFEQGRRIPKEIHIETGPTSHAQLVTLRFDDWRFPRSIPAAFFAIP